MSTGSTLTSCRRYASSYFCSARAVGSNASAAACNTQKQTAVLCGSRASSSFPTVHAAWIDLRTVLTACNIGKAVHSSGA